ncbi:MAG: hypothetical protein CFE21_11710 [Bacteroidetes bacterium B1(2017)]|nr:MAG: hypothetical protein CFE21_11710 [Bacteroidetes bacterium B1(2017)]
MKYFTLLFLALTFHFTSFAAIDLKVANYSINPTSKMAGNSITAYCAEQNIGTTAASTNVISIHISANTTLTPGSNGDTLIGEISISSCSGNSTTLTYSTTTVNIPKQYTAGTYYIFFSADGGQAITESNELNNFAYVSITISACSIGTPTSLIPNGSSTTPAIVNTNTPTLDWSDVTSASCYGVFIRDMTSNTLIYSVDGATTTSSFKVPIGYLSNNGKYRWNCQAQTNCNPKPCGSTIPSAFYFNVVCNDPTAAISPITRSINSGQGTTFTLITTGVNLIYKWQTNSGGVTWSDLNDNSTYAGTTSETLTINAGYKTINGFQFRCKVTSACTNTFVYSGLGTLTVLAPTPTNFQVLNYGAQTLRAVWDATSWGTNFIIYQNCTGTIVNTTNNYFDFTSLSPGQSFQYKIKGTNIFDTSLATSCISKLVPDSPPNLTSPSNLASSVSTTPTFQWQSSPNNAPYYQFEINTTSDFTGVVVLRSITNLTSLSYSSFGTLSSGTTYYWRVSSAVSTGSGSFIVGNFGSTKSFSTSSGCTSSSISNSPNSVTVNNGGSALFFLTASGSTITYQWQLSTNNGVTYNNISNGGLYSISPTTPSIINISTISSSMNGYKYRCKLDNCAGTTYSSAATLTVIPTPPATPVNVKQTVTTELAKIKDPINLSTKSYEYSKTDLSVPIIGGNLSFGHVYNSLNYLIDGPLGFGWTHTYNYSITNFTDTLWRVNLPNGNSRDFVPLMGGGGSSFPLYGGTTDTLYKTGVGYTLISKEQNVFQFDLTGRLKTITNPNNNVISLHFTGNLLDSIKGTGGRFLVLTGNTSTGKINSVSTASGKTCGFRIDINGNLASATNANTDSIHFTYDSEHQMLSFVNELADTVIRNVYTSHAVTGQFDAYGKYTSIAYDAPSAGKITVTYADNTNEEFAFNNFGVLTSKTNALSKSSIFKYDENFNLDTSANELNQQVVAQYDKYGNPISQTLPGNRTITSQFNAFQKPTSISNALGAKINFEYAPSTGNLSTVYFPDTSIRKFDYNSNGSLKFYVDGLGDSTYYYYNSFGDLIKIATPTGIRYYGYDTDGRLDSIRDENYNLTLLFYDEVGNIIRIKDALDQSIFYAYNKDNQRISFTDKRSITTYYYYDKKARLIAQKDALNGIDSFYYDVQDRLTKWVNALGDSVVYGYDLKGRRTSTKTAAGISRIEYNDIDNPTKIIDANNHELVLGYNSANILNSVTDSLQHTNSTTYDLNGNAISSTNYKGYVKSFLYDSLNALTKVIDVEDENTILRRDKNGNLSSLTDGNGHTQTFTHGKGSRLIAYKDGAQNSYSFTHDSIGNTKTITKPLGSITNQYDKLNRLVKQINSTGLTYTRTYNPNNNLLSISSNNDTTYFYYDVLNRMNRYVDPFGKQVSFGFNAIGNISYIVYPGNDTLKYVYDNANRLWKVIDWKSNVFTYTYDPTGKLLKLLYPTGIHCDYKYDAANRLLSRISYFPSDSILYGQTFTYYKDSIVELVYGYTKLGYTSSTFSYHYRDDDAATTDSLRYFTNDNNGNRTMEVFNGDTINFTYTVDQLMTSFTKKGINTTFKYNGLGTRIEKTIGVDVTRYVQNLNSPISFVLQTTDGNGALKANYIYGLGLLESIDASNNIYYYHFDASHNTVALTDIHDTIKASYSYSPYGAIWRKTGTLNQAFAFLGEFGVEQETDSMNFVRARYYDSGAKRFYSKDPLFGDQLDPQSLNRYVYALNNPLTTFDYSGLNGVNDGDGTTLSAPKTGIWATFVNNYYNYALGGEAGNLDGLTFSYLNSNRRNDINSNYSNAYSIGYNVHGTIATLSSISIAFVTGGESAAIELQGAASINSIGGATAMKMEGAGVYDLVTSEGRYIGQSKNFLKRLASHFGKGGKLSSSELIGKNFFSMEGSTTLEREVYEQYLIKKAGIENLINIRNPMGGRMDLYNNMIGDVISKFKLPL